jgi:hypothetical protein
MAYDKQERNIKENLKKKHGTNERKRAQVLTLTE